ncbi:hypothetical protein GJ496_006142 [Pomphorhynchus laevis]|nr:hypothetical protein GJ496_006142 [Pomphorhynchus laevis]
MIGLAWMAGYYGFSPAWGLLFLIFFLINRIRRKESDGLRLYFSSLQETDAIAMEAKWVNFPDFEQSEFLNQLLQKFWPFCCDYLKTTIFLEIVEKTVKSTSSLFSDFRFIQIDLGDIAPQIGGVRFHSKGTRFDEVIMDVEILYSGDAEIKFSLKRIPAGIKNIQLCGDARICFRPLVKQFPFIANVAFYFLRYPHIDFDFTNTASLVDIPGIRDAIMQVVTDFISGMAVLPNKFIMPMIPNAHSGDILKPNTKGVIAINMICARNLMKLDFGLIGKAKSDPYVNVFDTSRSKVPDLQFQVDASRSTVLDLQFYIDSSILTNDICISRVQLYRQFQIDCSRSTVTDRQFQIDSSGLTVPDRQLQINSSRSTDPDRQIQIDRSRSTDPDRQIQIDRSRSTDPDRQIQIDSSRSTASESTAPYRQSQIDSFKSTVPNKQFQINSSRSSVPDKHFQTDKSRSTALNRLFQIESSNSAFPDRQFQILISRSTTTDRQFQILISRSTTTDRQLQIGSYRSAVTDRQSTVPDRQFQIDSSRSTVPDRQLQIDSSRSTVTDRQFQIDTYRPTVADRQLQIDSYRSTVTDRQLQIDSYRSTVTDRQLQIDSYRSTVTDRQLQIDSYRSTVTDRQLQIDSYRSTVTDRQLQIDSYRSTVTDRHDVLILIQSHAHLVNGALIFRTSVKSNTSNPEWDERVNIIVNENERDQILFELRDEDPGEDDYLGSCTLTIEEIIVKGSIERWMVLENATSGELYLEANWLRAVQSKSMSSSTQLSKNDDKLPKAILMVFVGAASNLQRVKKKGSNFTEPNPYCVFRIEQYTFLIKHPDSNYLSIKVEDQKTDSTIGLVRIPLRSIYQAPNLELEKTFTLSTIAHQQSSNSTIFIHLSMRILMPSKSNRNESANKFKLKITHDENNKDIHADYSSLPDDSNLSTATDHVLATVDLSIKYHVQRRVLIVKVLRANNLSHYQFSDRKVDTYAKLWLSSNPKEQVKTHTIRNTNNPQFEQTFEWEIEYEAVKNQCLCVLFRSPASLVSVERSHKLGEVYISLSKLDVYSQSTGSYALKPKCNEPEMLIYASGFANETAKVMDQIRRSSQARTISEQNHLTDSSKRDMKIILINASAKGVSSWLHPIDLF